MARHPQLADAVKTSITVITTLANLNICFVAGTLVHPTTAYAHRDRRAGAAGAIAADLQPDGDTSYRRVLETFVTHPTELVHVEYESASGRERLSCTLTHPFFSVPHGEFVAAGELAVGDVMALADGGVAQVIGLERESAVGGAPLRRIICRSKAAARTSWAARVSGSTTRAWAV